METVGGSPHIPAFRLHRAKPGSAIATLLVLTTVCTTGSAWAGIEAEFEAGYVFTSRNDTRIPGKGGTDLSLANDLTTDPAPAYRVRLGYRIADRHFVTALYAP